MSVLLGGIALIIGSFLTVLIYRLPKMIKGEEVSPLVPRRSFCPHCNTILTPVHIIPILGYIFQKGKCSHCNTNISIVYPIVEVITLVITILLYMIIGWDEELIFWLLLGYGCIILFFTDCYTRLVPDVITIPLIWIGLVFHAWYGDIHSAIIGAIVGYISLWSIYWIYKFLTSKEGMGYGDFKVFAMIGTWLGWYSLSYVMLITCLLAIIYFIILVKNNLTPLPLVSFMILATIIYTVLNTYVIA